MIVTLHYIQKVKSQVNSKSSGIYTWLASLSYFLVRHIIMPFDFCRMDII